MRFLLLIVLLAGCGRTPTAPPVQACAVKPVWGYATPAAKALGLPDSVLVSSTLVCQ